MMLFSKRAPGPVTCYREVLFDQSAGTLRPVSGEQAILELREVEDTKAGKYERGKLLVTNLRFIWVSTATPTINLCIGLHTIHKLDMHSRARSDVQPLHMLTTFKATKFEFIFTPATNAQSHELIQTAQLLVRAFTGTTRYRELRMRANITESGSDKDAKDLVLLDGEELHRKVSGVMNLSKDYGQLGTFWITNLRVAWAAQLQEYYNCSMPYLQIKSVRQQQTKFGTVLVVDMFPQPQRFLLGFQIKPPELLQTVLQDITMLLQLGRAKPTFGIQLHSIVNPQLWSDSMPSSFEAEEHPHKEGPSVPGDGLAAYYAAGASNGDLDPVFDSSIGLTVEAMPPDVTLKTLWSVL